MASGTGNTGGLLVIGAVLALAAVTIKSSLRDSSAVPEGLAIAPGGEAGPSRTPAEEPIKGENSTMSTSEQTKNVFGSVDHANDADFQQKVLNSQGRVLVDFYADWCGPCRMIAPVLEEVAREEPTARIVKVNVDHSPNAAASFGIQSIPALLVFENGNVVGQHVGVASKSQMRSLLGL